MRCEVCRDANLSLVDSFMIGHARDRCGPDATLET